MLNAGVTQCRSAAVSLVVSSSQWSTMTGSGTEGGGLERDEAGERHSACVGTISRDADAEVQHPFVAGVDEFEKEAGMDYVQRGGRGANRAIKGQLEKMVDLRAELMSAVAKWRRRKTSHGKPRRHRL